MVNTDSERFIVSVNYDDLQWREIDQRAYKFVDPRLMSCHFPLIGHGVSEVIMEYVTFDYGPTIQDVLEEFPKRQLRHPVRSEVESFLDQYPEDQTKFPVIGLCGTVTHWSDGPYAVAIRGGLDGRHLYFCWFLYRELRICRFLAVRPA